MGYWDTAPATVNVFVGGTVDMQDYGAPADGVKDARASIFNANEIYESLFFSSGTFRISSSLTLTAEVWMFKGAKFSVDSGVTLTINGHFKADQSQVFTGSGSVVFGNNNVDYVIPQWWGAVNDGVSDDVLGIQAAVDAYGVVFFPKGTYIISAAINVPSDTTVYGVGKASLLSWASGSAHVMMQNKALDAGTDNDIYISNLGFYGGPQSAPGTAADGDGLVYFQATTRFAVSNCYVEGGVACGIVATHSLYGLIFGNYVKDSSGESIDCGGCSYVRIQGNYVENSNGDGITIYAHSPAASLDSIGCEAVGNIINGLNDPAVGILVGLGDGTTNMTVKVENFVVSGNVIKGGTSQVNIAVWGGAIHGVVTGNSIIGGGDGISVSGFASKLAPSNVVISGNNVRESGGNGGISVYNQGDPIKNIVISNNTTYSGDVCGIYIRAYANCELDHISVCNNSIYNNGQVQTYGDGIYALAQTGATITSLLVSGNNVWDDQSPKTQRYGLFATLEGTGAFADCQVSNNLLKDSGLTADYSITSGFMVGSNPSVYGWPTERLEGWVTKDTQNPTIGILPANSYVTAVRMEVTEAFNSAGTDNISLGIDGDVATYCANVDVSSTGIKTPTMGSRAGYNATLRTVEAYYVNSGTEPTTGKALVTLEFYRVTATP